MMDDLSQLRGAFTTTERECESLARLLHETLCQSLTSATLMLRVLVRRAEKGAGLDAASLKSLAEIVGGAAHEAHVLRRRLQPVEGGPGGLMESLEQLARDTNVMRFECERPVPISNSEIASALYRIAQESVSDVRRNSAAGPVTLRLTQDDENIVLEIVEESGQEVSNADSSAKESMRYRATAVGGTLRTRFVAGTGMVTTVTVPKKITSH